MDEFAVEAVGQAGSEWLVLRYAGGLLGKSLPWAVLELERKLGRETCTNRAVF